MREVNERVVQVVLDGVRRVFVFLMTGGRLQRSYEVVVSNRKVTAQMVKADPVVVDRVLRMSRS